jgi:hypothetical protein
MPELPKLQTLGRRAAHRKGARPFAFSPRTLLLMAPLLALSAGTTLIDAKNLLPSLALFGSSSDANDLVGLTASSTRHLFGPPAMKRAEEPAEIWQYRRGNCVLDLYLYSDENEAKVQHAELRHRSDHGSEALTGRAANRCLKALKQG